MNTNRFWTEFQKKVNLSDTFRVSFHRPDGVLDGCFNNVNGHNLKEILNILPNLWIAVVFNISENEFQFSRNNF
jgi:hypothetical protein